MPALTTEQREQFDITQFVSVGFCYISQPELVFSAPLTGGFYSAGAVVALSYGTPTVGSFSDIEAEQTLELWNSSYNAFGSQRIRAAATASAIFVGRSSQGRLIGELQIADGAVIKVFKERKAFSKIPWISPNGTQYKDTLAYPGDNASQPPVANAGPDALIVVNNWETEATISLDALGDVPSFAVRNGATLSSYSWNLDDGSVVTGTLSSSSLTATFPLGERYVRLTVTDSNGITHTAYKFVVVATKAMCIPVRIAEEIIRPTGVSWRFSVNLEGLPSGVREGTKVLYTQHDDYSLQQVAVRFSGWLGPESFKLKSPKKQQKEITITCYDVAERLRQIHGFPLTVEITSGTSGWYRMPNANIDRLTHHYLQWHTNLLSLADFSWSGQGATYPLPRFTTDGATIWEQGDRLARAIAYTLTCNSKGQIKVKGDPMILPTAAQAALYSLPTQRTSTVVTTLTEDDYGEHEFDAALPPGTHWLRGSAVVASNTVNNIKTVKSAAPSKTPGQGRSTQEETEQLVTGQAEFNARLANRYAARVNPRMGRLTLNMVKSRHILEPADMEWIKIILPADERAKYPDLSAEGDNYLVSEIVNRYDLEKLRKNSTWVCEREFEGVVNNDMTVVDPPPPPSSPNNPTTTVSVWEDNYVPVEPTVQVIQTIYGLPPASQNLLAVMTDGTIAVTNNFDNPSYLGGPTWTVYDHSADLGTDVRAFTYDASNNGSGVSGWFVTPDDIIYGEDLETATPTFTIQSSFPATAAYVNIDADYVFNVGLFVVCVYAIDTGASSVYYARVTLDGGATWEDDVELSTVGGDPVASGLHVATQVEGTAWATAAGVGDDTIYDFTDSNESFSVTTHGSYSPGVGFIQGEWTEPSGPGAGNSHRGVAIERTGLALGTVYRVRVIFDYVQGDPDNPAAAEAVIQLNGGTVASRSFDNIDDGNDQTWEWSGFGSVEDVTEILVQINCDLDLISDGARTMSGSVTIKQIIINDGDNRVSIYTTDDYGATWEEISEEVYLESGTGGLLVPFPDADARYLFAGDFVNGTASKTFLVDDDTNNLLRIDLNDNSMVNITPVVDGVHYGAAYLDNQTFAPRGAFETPTGNINILFLIGTESAFGKAGVFLTLNALAEIPSWNVLIEPGVDVPYRKLVVDENPRELYLFGVNGAIAYTDTPTDGSTIDSRLGDLSTSAEIIAIAGFMT